MTTTIPASIQKMLDWQKANAGKLHYSETASTRLHYETAADLLTATDCSGNFIRLHRHFAPGTLMDATYTGNLMKYGQLITTSKAAVAAGKGLLPGDGVLFDFVGEGSPTHIAMYAGAGKIENHGGPNYNDMGPDLWTLADSVNEAHNVWAVRYISSDTAVPDSESNPVPESTDLLEWIMSLPGAPKGLTYSEFIGDIVDGVLGHRLPDGTKAKDGTPNMPQLATFIESTNKNVADIKSAVKA